MKIILKTQAFSSEQCTLFSLNEQKKLSKLNVFKKQKKPKFSGFLYILLAQSRQGNRSYSIQNRF